MKAYYTLLLREVAAMLHTPHNGGTKRRLEPCSNKKAYYTLLLRELFVMLHTPHNYGTKRRLEPCSIMKVFYTFLIRVLYAMLHTPYNGLQKRRLGPSMKVCYMLFLSKVNIVPHTHHNGYTERWFLLRNQQHYDSILHTSPKAPVYNG